MLIILEKLRLSSEGSAVKRFVLLVQLLVSVLPVWAEQNPGQARNESDPSRNQNDPLATDTNSALGYLNKMSTALRMLNYHGTLIYVNDGNVESLKLIHKKDSDGEYQRLVHLSGDAREVIRDNDTVTCYLPDSQSVHVGSRRFNNHLLAKLTSSFADFSSQYEFDIEGLGRVAGREATIIAIRPKDGYRYGYRFWVDKESSLLLKSDLVDTKGKVLEQLMFVQLEVVEDIPQQMLKPDVSGESFTWHDGSAKSSVELTANSVWQIKELPIGFSITGRSKQLMPNNSEPVDYIVVSDGLASISVYIEQPNAAKHGFVGASRRGAVNIYGSVLNEHQITVVGEVPQQTVQMIADSIFYK